jgi:hypothetical protein
MRALMLNKSGHSPPEAHQRVEEFESLSNVQRRGHHSAQFYMAIGVSYVEEPTPVDGFL